MTRPRDLDQHKPDTTGLDILPALKIFKRKSFGIGIHTLAADRTFEPPAPVVSKPFGTKPPA
jgi:hypothetical protein